MFYSLQSTMAEAIRAVPLFRNGVAVVPPSVTADELAAILAEASNRVVLVAPEAMLHVDVWQAESHRQWEALSVSAVRYPVCLLFIDEAHLIHNWGTFRQSAYANHTTLTATALPRVVVRAFLLTYP